MEHFFEKLTWRKSADDKKVLKIENPDQLSGSVKELNKNYCLWPCSLAITSTGFMVLWFSVQEYPKG